MMRPGSRPGCEIVNGVGSMFIPMYVISVTSYAISLLQIRRSPAQAAWEPEGTLSGLRCSLKCSPPPNLDRQDGRSLD
jgi:hypothetical protein